MLQILYNLGLSWSVASAAALNDHRIISLESQTLAKKQPSFKVFFLTQKDHRHCLATITFILDIYWL